MERVRIAGRTVDPSLNRVTSTAGETVQVEPKIMQVLIALAERPGELVTRDELMARVWSGVNVTDDALHRTIRELRRLFDDDAEAPTVIETIRKRGYRLIAAVEIPNLSPGVRSGDRPRVSPGVSPRRLWPALVVIAVAIVAIARFELRGQRDRANAPSGVEFLPLTSDQGNEISPALSATAKLAYIARGADGRAHVFIKTSPNATPLQVTDGDGTDHAPMWSPDETHIGFVRTDPNGCRIVIARADGGDPRTVSPCLSRSEFKMSWSPDGQWIAAATGELRRSAPSRIVLVSVADGHATDITAPPHLYAGDYEPSFSPDGRSIAFVRVISGGMTMLCVAPADGAEPRCLTSDSDILGVDWDPGGRHLIFSSDRGGSIGIWRIPAAGSAREPESLAGGGAKLKHPSVARKTGQVAYEDWQYEINLREGPVRPGSTDDWTPLSATSDRWNFHPQISPDGRRIAFQSTRSGSYEIWIGDRDGGHARKLTDSRTYKSMPRWSPDGRSIVFTMRRTNSQVELVVVDANSGAARVVAAAGDLVAPSWSHDGARILVSGRLVPMVEDMGPAINVVDPRSGEAEVMGTAFAAMESIDGKALYVSQLMKSGLARRSRHGDEQVRGTDHVAADQWPNWGVYDRGIYYVGYPDDGDPQLFFVEDDSPTEIPRTRLPEMAWPGISVSRDGSRVIYAHADRRSSNIGGLLVR